jgi:hypothetical protein
MAMRLVFISKNDDLKDGPYWYARTAKGGYDGSGATPADAVADLAVAMEKALGENERDLD